MLWRRPPKKWRGYKVASNRKLGLYRGAVSLRGALPVTAEVAGVRRSATGQWVLPGLRVALEAQWLEAQWLAARRPGATAAAAARRPRQARRSGLVWMVPAGACALGAGARRLSLASRGAVAGARAGGLGRRVAQVSEPWFASAWLMTPSRASCASSRGCETAGACAWPGGASRSAIVCARPL